MFPNDIDDNRYPLHTRKWGIAVGSLIMVAVVPLCLVSPGTLQITLPILLAVCLFVSWTRGELARVLTPTVTHGGKIAAALLGFAALSALWSDKPLESLGWATSTALAALACGIGFRYLLLEPRSNALHIAEGLWIGFLAGLLYLGTEALTDQAIKIFFYNLVGLKPSQLKPLDHFIWKQGRLVAIDGFDLTRSFTAVPLIVWGAILAILGSQRHRFAKPLAWATYLLTAGVLMAGNNETTKVAIIVGSIAFAIAWWSKSWSSRLLRVSWVVICLAIVPITLGLYRANLHNAPWVQSTAQHRIIIWNRFTEETMKRPLLGVGAGMAYWKFDPHKEAINGEAWARYSRDVHCVYLQIWFELGVIGAVLLSLLGLAIIQRLDRLPAAVVPYAHASFASAAAILGSSYGLWRPWFNLTFLIGALSFAIGLRAMLERQHVLRFRRRKQVPVSHPPSAAIASK